MDNLVRSTSLFGGQPEPRMGRRIRSEKMQSSYLRMRTVCTYLESCWPKRLCRPGRACRKVWEQTTCAQKVNRVTFSDSRISGIQKSLTMSKVCCFFPVPRLHGRIPGRSVVTSRASTTRGAAGEFVPQKAGKLMIRILRKSGRSQSRENIPLAGSQPKPATDGFFVTERARKEPSSSPRAFVI